MFIDNRFEEAKNINNCDGCDDNSDDDPDKINHKIQAEMEQHMFENGKDYEDYQEPQLYDTEEDLVDSLNNDLDDCLSKE